MIARFLTDQRGSTAIEYALLAMMLGAALIAAIASIGGSLSSLLGGAVAGFGG